MTTLYTAFADRFRQNLIAGKRLIGRVAVGSDLGVPRLGAQNQIDKAHGLDRAPIGVPY